MDLQHLSPLSQRHSADNHIQSLQITQLKSQLQQLDKRYKDDINQKEKAYAALKKALNSPSQPRKIEELAKLLNQKDKEILDYQNKLMGTDSELRKELENYASQIDSLQLSSAYATARIEELNKALAERETNARDVMRFSGERSPVASAKNADLLHHPFGLPQHSILHHPNITKTLEDNESNIFNLSKDSERYHGLAMRSQAELEIRTPRVVLDEITKILKQATKSEQPGSAETNPDKPQTKTAKATEASSKPRLLTTPEEPLERVLEKVKILVGKISQYEKELGETKEKNLELERIKAEKIAENDELIRKLQSLRLDVRNLEKTIENFKDMIHNSQLGDQLQKPASIETSMIKMDGNDGLLDQSKKPSIRLVSTRDVGGARPTLPPMAPNASPERGRLSVKDNRAVLRRGASAITGGMNTFMSLPMTDDSNMGQMYELIEELRKVGKAKDEVQGKIKDLLKEPMDNNDDSYSSGRFDGHRFNEETIKILEAHHWAGKKFFESEENSRTPGMMSPPRDFRKQSIGEEGFQDRDTQVEAQTNLINELLERIAVLEKETNFYKRAIPLATTGKIDPIDDNLLPDHGKNKSGVRSEMILPQSDDLELNIGNRIKTEGSPYTPAVDHRGKSDLNSKPPKIDYKFIDTPTRFDSDSMQWINEKPDPQLDINLSPVVGTTLEKAGISVGGIQLSQRHQESLKILPKERQTKLIQTVLPFVSTQNDMKALKSALLDKIIEVELLAANTTGGQDGSPNQVSQNGNPRERLPAKQDIDSVLERAGQLEAENQNLKEILEDIRKKFLEGKIVEVAPAEVPDNNYSDPPPSHEDVQAQEGFKQRADNKRSEKSVGKSATRPAKQAGSVSNAFGKKTKPAVGTTAKTASAASNPSKRTDKAQPTAQDEPKSVSRLQKQASENHGEAKLRDQSRKQSATQPDKAASQKHLGKEPSRSRNADMATRPLSGPQSSRTVNTLAAGSEYDGSSEALYADEARLPAQSAIAAENAAVENELEELLKATTGELAGLQEKCLRLEEQVSSKDSQLVALRRDLSVMVQQLELFKKENLIAINQEEIDQFKAISNQMNDLTKNPEDLIAENSELVEYLKKAKQETLDLKTGYLQSLTIFHENVAKMKEKETSPDQMLMAIQEEQDSCYERSDLQLRQFNLGLWEAVIKQKKVTSNLSKRIQTIDRWSKDLSLGLPGIETEVNEELDLPPSVAPAELKALESMDTKPSTYLNQLGQPQEKQTQSEIESEVSPAKAVADVAADPPRTSDRPRRSDDEAVPLPNETLIDLLLSMVGLTEDLKQVCSDETKTDADKVVLLTEKIDNFELVGQDGKLDLANIQKFIGRPESVGEQTESTYRRKPYSDIMEVPEEDDEEDTRRGIKSSVDRSKHNSRRQRLDSERKGTDSKDGSNETPGVSSGVRKTAEIQDLHKRLDEALERNKLLAVELEAERRKQFVKVESMVDDKLDESSRSLSMQPSEENLNPKGLNSTKRQGKAQPKKKPVAQDEQVATLTAQMKEVAAKLVQSDAQNQILSQSVAQLTEYLEKSQIELQAANKTLSIQTTEVTRLNQLLGERSETNSPNESAKQAKSAGTISELTKRVQGLENTILSKDTEIIKLKSLLNSSRQPELSSVGLAGLSSSLDEVLGERLAKLALDLKKSQSAEEVLRKEVNELRSQAAQTGAFQVSRDIQIDEKQPADSNWAQGRIADLEKQVAVAQDVVALLQEQQVNERSGFEEELSNLRRQMEGLASQTASLRKEVEAKEQLIAIKDSAIEELKAQLNAHAERTKPSQGGRPNRAAADEAESERHIVKLISENQKLKESAAIFERNFEQREKELLDEINRLAGELTVIMNLQGTPVPASIHKTVENARLQSMLK